MLSVVIPARNEPYLQKTIDDIFDKAEEDLEIITILDGYWPDPPLKEDKRVKVIHWTESRGMRKAINAGAKIAQGKYLMKCDAHCCFDQGFDKKLKADCEYDWTVVPRRYDLRRKTWERGDKIYDFQYITNPKDERYPMKGANWPEYAERVKVQEICDLMTSQGSCWFMHWQRFWDLGGLDDVNYGTMGREAQETCLKAWLSGGRYVLNRKTWYAHWKKNAGKHHPWRATYPKPVGDREKSRDYVIECFTKNNWPLQKRKFEWIIEHFKPVPTWHRRESLEPIRYIQETWKLGNAQDLPIELKGINRVDMYKLFKKCGYKRGAEIGVWAGRNAQDIVHEIPRVRLFLIDQYKDYRGARKPRGNSRHQKAEHQAHKAMKSHNVKFLKMKSEEAINHFKDGTLDFVYIDGNHLYDYAMLDILLWSRKVRVGGVISGHDYYNADKSRVGVKSAVDDYTRYHKINPWYITDMVKERERKKKNPRRSWFWVKQ